MDMTGAAIGFNKKLTGTDLFTTKLEVEKQNQELKMRNGNREIKQNMGKDEFLQLLVTELRHQDPTNPMKDREFIAQMAQFSSLEQMLNMNKGMEQLVSSVSFQSSFNLLGKNVEVAVEGPEQTTYKKGVVQSVSKKAGENMVTVNGESYPVSNVVKIAE